MTESQQPPAPTGFSPITEERLQEVAQRIVETFDPERIILFGSYASGESTPDSDVDLLVVMENEEAREAVEAMKTVRRFVRSKLELPEEL